MIKVQGVCAEGDVEACGKVKFTETGSFLGGLSGGIVAGALLGALLPALFVQRLECLLVGWAPLHAGY